MDPSLADRLQQLGIMVLRSRERAEEVAANLEAHQLGEAEVGRLFRYARKVSASSARGLLWHWLKEPRRAVDVLADLRPKSVAPESERNNGPLTPGDILDTMDLHGEQQAEG